MQRNDTTAGKKTPLIDVEEVRRAMRLLLPAGQVTELRVLDAVTTADRWPHTTSGYFDDAEKLIDALGTIKSAKGIYITPNPVDRSLLARAANRIRKAPKGESTADSNIAARRWLLIDADAQRASGISASDAEHAAAIDRCQRVREHLHALGWPDPITADSGNGGHLLYRVDLPVDDAGLVQRCLAALAARFDDDAVKIDQTVFNPARIWKLYGTLACKGDSTPNRPHRMSRTLSAPDPVLIVDRALLASLAAEVPTDPPRDPSHHGNGQAFDVDFFIGQNGLEVDGPDPWQGGRRWVFRRSPLCEHHEGAAFLIQHASGALAAKCHHNSCDWGWRELRAKYDAPRHATNGHDGFTQSAANGKKKSPAKQIEAYIPFPVESLPAVVGGFVGAAAAAIGCDPSFIALPLLGCLARAIGNKRVIRLKRSWTEPAIIWAAIVGKSGTHKTPAIQAAMHHLQRKQADAIAQHVEALAKHEEERAVYDREYAAWKHSRKSGPTEPPPWPPQEPVCQRYVTTDTTIEALASLLAAQFDGLLVSRDELAGWLGGIAEYKGGQGSDLGHWLASWSAAPLTVDRKTGAVKMLHVPRAAVSIVGGIQPGVLRKAIGHEHMQDGLCARLLLAMPDPKPVRWSEAIVDPSIEAALTNIFDRLLALEPAADEDGQPAPFAMPLTSEAKAVWVTYYNRHRAEIAELDDDLAAAWSKLEAYAARFALVFQLCSWAAGEQYASADAIDEAAMRNAIAMSDWFGGEARRVYGVLAECEADREDRELVELIRRKGGAVTARELQMSSRHHRESGEAEAALDQLAQAGYGQWQVVPTARRPRREFRLSALSTSTVFDESRETRNTVDVDAVDISNARTTNGPDPDAINRLFAESMEGDE